MHHIHKIIFYLIGLVFSISVYSQDFDRVEIKTHKITDSIYMLEGAGGNIGICVGEDGVFLIDDQFAPLTEKIKAAIAEISDKQIKFVINTHWHYDHVGGNENLGEAGAVIVAHENVRKRMSTEQVMEFFTRTIPPSPKAALPVITFTRDISFHLNGEETEVFHVKYAHTDGDAVVYFKNTNILHTGDVYFNGIYPFIDLGSGGSVKGIIEASERILARIDDNTNLIPGHGPLSDKAGLNKYTQMLHTIHDRVKKQISDGRLLEEIQKLRPSEDFDEVWGKGFLKPDQFIAIIYQDLTTGE